jgi:hypothetical protein
MAENTRAPVLTGGCQCGAVRYALYAEPSSADICHCRMCTTADNPPPGGLEAVTSYQHRNGNA